MVDFNPTRRLASRVAMMPRDTNGEGHIFGGVLLSHIDLAGYDVARYACKDQVIERLVTRAIDKIEFKKPVLVNDIVTCYANVTRIGRTSISAHVDVEVDRQGLIIPVTSADAVYVPVDRDGNKLQVSCCSDHMSQPQPARPQIIQPALDPSKRVLAMRKMMMPADTNGRGDIFGGVLLSSMDLAGSYVARRACGSSYINRCVTRFMDKVEFRKAVHVDDVINCWGTITHMGNTSVGVHVDVESERHGETIHVTSADLVFVALDEQGRPTPVRCGISPAPSRWDDMWANWRRWWNRKPRGGCGCS